MEARSDIDAQIVRYTELLEAKDKSNHLVADSLRQFPRTKHNITHTQQHTEKEDMIRETQGKQGKLEEKNMFSRVFLHGVAVVPLTFHNVSNFFASRCSFKTFSQVDVTQPVGKCSKLQREAKKWTRCGRSTAFSVIQRLLPSSIPNHVGRNWMRLTREEGKKRRRREEKRRREVKLSD